jgi:AcrR family transcriptional regulator
MAVYTHFGGMRSLIAEVADEGWAQFDAAQSVPQTDDPVADLMATGIAYRRFAIERPHMYRLMFGSTSAHGIRAPIHNVLTLMIAEIEQDYPAFSHVVHAVHRCMRAGRFPAAGSADDDANVVATAAQFWSQMHGFVMLELAGFFGDAGAAVGPVLASMTTNLLVALGDSPDKIRRSLAAAVGG